MLIILDQFSHRQEVQRLNKPKLAVLVKDLYQLIAATFPVIDKSCSKFNSEMSNN